ncbi:MAG: peptidoglycan-binding protein LysM [Alphaproteobacteria bacterium]
MGLFNFLKNIGKAHADETPTAETLTKEIKDLGLDADGVQVKVDGDKVIIDGEATQEVLEKVVLATGNSKGIASVETNVKVTDNGAEAEFHTVEKGDTLSAIAKKVYGNANRYPEIFEANKPMLTHPDKIYPGQVLRIPR